MPLVCSGWRLFAIGGHFFLMLFMLVSILNFFKLFVLIPCGNNFLKNIWFNCFQSDFFQLSIHHIIVIIINKITMFNLVSSLLLQINF